MDPEVHVFGRTDVSKSEVHVQFETLFEVVVKVYLTLLSASLEFTDPALLNLAVTVHPPVKTAVAGAAAVTLTIYLPDIAVEMAILPTAAAALAGHVPS